MAQSVQRRQARMKIARYAKIPAAQPQEFSVPGKLAPNMTSPARDG